MYAFNRFLLAGTSHLAIFVVGAGGAFAGAGDEITFNTGSVNGGALTNANSGTSYSSGVLTINGDQASTVTGGRAVYINGNSSEVSPLRIDVGATITGASGQKTPTETNSGSGLMVEDTVSGPITITNRGTITGGDGGASYGAGSGIDVQSSGAITVNNYGVINSGAVGTSGFPRVAVSLDMAQHAVTLNNYSGGVLNGGIGTSTHGDQINFYGGTLNGSILGQATSGGAIKGTGADVYFRSGTTTVNGDIGKPFGTSVTLQGQTAYWGPVKTVTVADGSTLALGSDSQIYSQGITLFSNSTFDLGTHKLTWNYVSGASENMSQTFILKTTINADTGKHGYWVFDGMTPGTMFSNGVPVITPTVVGTVSAGSKYVIVQDTAGRTVVNTPSVINSGGYRWTVSNVTGAGQTDTNGVSFGTGYTNVVITAVNLNAAGSATGVNGAGVRALATYSGGDSRMQALSQAVNNLTSDADIKKAGAQLRPETTGNIAQASMGAVTQALSTIQVRTDEVRVAAAETGTGVSTGETLKGLGVWGQGFGSTASQDERNAVSGYDADTYGLAFGGDVKVIDPLRIGLHVAYARTGLDSTGDRSGSGQDIDSYITSLYGTYSGAGWYVDGAVTYGIHKYDATRYVNIAGAAAQSLKASYDGQQYGAKAEVGVPQAVGQAVVTPLASLAYNNLSQDSYSETGGVAALNVGSSSTDSIRSGLGAKVSAKVATIGNWEFSPTARAVWHHEFNKSSQDQTSAYVAGGSAFTTPGSDIATERLNLGLGVDVTSVRNTTISAKYDAELADRYASHSASLQLRTEF